ncbi:hypothetical protein GCM10007937_42570 [Mesorhizobium albiziae]|nr:hypothetical protein GCM10007937_42570 [Mesorhizobium albiziae]
MGTAEPLAYSTQASVRGCEGLGLLATMSEARHRSARITACFDIATATSTWSGMPLSIRRRLRRRKIWRSAQSLPSAKDRMFLPRISSNDFGISQVIECPHVAGVERVEQ